MRFSVVIPTYNHCDDLLKPCIESIIKYTDLSEIELIVVANGCTDNTTAYLKYVESVFDMQGLGWNVRTFFMRKPMGFAAACNFGIEEANGDAVILLNNDTVLLDQPKNRWLEIFEEALKDETVGVASVMKGYHAGLERSFGIFFCVAIPQRAKSVVGLLDENFGVGGGEDVDYCIRAENAGFKVVEVVQNQMGDGTVVGGFPIYHKGEGTVHDQSLVQDWDSTFSTNMRRVLAKHDPARYRFVLSNNYERAIFLKGDLVFPRERARYVWANQHLWGEKILEVGCSTGYGSQFLTDEMEYWGIDYDPIIIEVAHEQSWGSNRFFKVADINHLAVYPQDTIIAFEVIEHLENGLEIVEKLKKSCRRLLISVPHNESPGFWGEHHKLHGLTEKDFPGAQFSYVDAFGAITDTMRPVDDVNKFNLMLCRWDNE